MQNYARYCLFWDSNSVVLHCNSLYNKFINNESDFEVALASRFPGSPWQFFNPGADNAVIRAKRIGCIPAPWQLAQSTHPSLNYSMKLALKSLQERTFFLGLDPGSALWWIFPLKNDIALQYICNTHIWAWRDFVLLFRDIDSSCKGTSGTSERSRIDLWPL